MAQIAAGLAQGTTSTQHLFNFFRNCWDAFLERRERQRVLTNLYDLSNRELLDFGIARGEIEYAALNRDADPRGARSAYSNFQYAHEIVEQDGRTAL
jgi:uncharacterized protein YjiS (DUF1127 family)